MKASHGKHLPEATAKLRDYVRGHADDVADFGGPIAGDLIQALLTADADGYAELERTIKGRTRKLRVPLQQIVDEALLPLLDAEGKVIFAGMDRTEWSKTILEKLDFFDGISYGYDSEAVDRSSARWRAMQRRNVTLPTGLAYEVAAVLEHLRYSSPSVKISLSGLVEVALRELLHRPIDRNDARYAAGDSTIADLIKREDVGLRRRGAAAS